MIMGRQSRLPCMDADWPLFVNTKTVVTKVAGLAAVGTKQQQGQCYGLKQILPPGAAYRGTSDELIPKDTSSPKTQGKVIHRPLAVKREDASI